jgi:hypothetical protein
VVVYSQFAATLDTSAAPAQNGSRTSAVKIGRPTPSRPRNPSSKPLDVRPQLGDVRMQPRAVFPMAGKVVATFLERAVLQLEDVHFAEESSVLCQERVTRVDVVRSRTAGWLRRAQPVID